MDRHKAKLWELEFHKGCKHQDIYKWVLEYLSAGPNRPIDFSAESIKGFYNLVDPIIRTTLQIRTCPVKGHKFKEVPARRMYYGMEGTMEDPYNLRLYEDSDEDPEVAKKEFFASKNRYLATSLNGGYVNEYYLPTYKGEKVPLYQEDFTDKYTID